ncbi:putative Phenylalanine--tRNA ligase alpha subunit [Blattamonas nauphoetae]|uniref:phenylalanine--tRNA ligase n=1 Tax=Blattamonas nauphoetae TaxID=2049346 RepID=A0ABQ9XFC1_9EUKA|nr:putative Phenylalanine--tRNA ligase alpha subunit [Blattamonas nauphoetae]
MDTDKLRIEFQKNVHDFLRQNNKIEDLASAFPIYATNTELYHPALQSLQSKAIVTVEVKSTTKMTISKEGESCLAAGHTPEGEVMDIVMKGPIQKTVLLAPAPNAPQATDKKGKKVQDPRTVAFFALTKQKLIETDADGNVVVGSSLKQADGTTKPFEDTIFLALQQFAKGEDVKPELVKELTKKNYIEKQIIKSVVLAKGTAFDTFTTEEQVLLTNQMLLTDEWKTHTFKEKNFTVPADLPKWGKLHPLQEMRSHFRRVFLRLGFTEMFTRRYVESSFWNFDTLFQAQSHPCRDIQDTFFVASPTYTMPDQVLDAPCSLHPSLPAQPKNELERYYMGLDLPEELIPRIQQVHEGGGDVCSDSLGYRYKWNRAEASKVILRTHTTAMSTRTLSTLNEGLKRVWRKNPSSQSPERPLAHPPIHGEACLSHSLLNDAHSARFFSIDRVYRNETVDKTHLAEFHQLEGFVVGRGLNVAHLIGTITHFFAEVGMTQFKFQPTYNPYTEPSMEMHAYHPILKKFIEIGNSGIFREEVMVPLGIDKDVRAIAWGFGLERPSMLQCDVSEIGALFGGKVDEEWVRESVMKIPHK